MYSRDRQRRLLRAWRGSPLAPLMVLALLAMSGPGACASATPVTAAGMPLPDPVRFRAHLSRLLAQSRYDEAAELLADTRPELLAVAASERADVRYMVVLPGVDAPPGIDPFPRPARLWTIRLSESAEACGLSARLRQFAADYNRALAREERGVR